MHLIPLLAVRRQWGQRMGSESDEEGDDPWRSPVWEVVLSE
ncbi:MULTISPECIES: hypothetical protein [unclassified Synechocystis]|nr:MULTISPECIES: hypothetical protein [unclassified Synechocystis]